MNNVYIIDMDNTILNTREFKRELGLFLTDGKNNNISNNEILQYFINEEERVKEFFDKGIENFLFDGVSDKILELKKGGKTILLTHGLIDFQLLKTNALPIELFDKVILTDANKGDEVQEILNDFSNDDKIYFINDRIDQNEDIEKRFFGKVKVISINNYDDIEELKIKNIFKKLR